MSKKSAKTQAEIDWENRRLCRDESCIGTIGPDGRCKECGMSLSSQKGNNETLEKIESLKDIPNESSDTPVEEPEILESEIDVGWENRTLCVDESCIGVIGPDGQCKECGKPYK